MAQKNFTHPYNGYPWVSVTLWLINPQLSQQPAMGLGRNCGPSLEIKQQQQEQQDREGPQGPQGLPGLPGPSLAKTSQNTSPKLTPFARGP